MAGALEHSELPGVSLAWTVTELTQWKGAPLPIGQHMISDGTDVGFCIRHPHFEFDSSNQSFLNPFICNMQTEKFPDAISPDGTEGRDSGEESAYTVGGQTNKRKAGSEGRATRAKKLALEPVVR